MALAKGLVMEDFDSIQLIMPDMHSVPRGKVVVGDSDIVKEGFDLWRGAVLLGPKGEIASSVPYMTSSFPSHHIRPCIETLTPWPWLSTEKRRVGSVVCDMYNPDGSPDMMCPRQQLKVQLNTLRERYGLMIKTAFEYEFFAFKENTLEPLGSDHFQFCDLRVWGQHQDLFSELRETIQTMGIKINALHPEFPPGQWELTTFPYAGVTGADVGFYIKNAVKAFLKNRGYDATFMSRPVLSSIGSGLHLNHSLWKPVTADGKEENVFAGNGGDVSSIAKHWIAGLLTHADALSALVSPSLNCYRRFYGLTAPSLSTWGINDRNAAIRAVVQGSNAYLENRLVSAAASPYLALAATVAAGLQGLDQRLECPLQMDSGKAKTVPHSLAQALTALEEDHQLVARLGKEFVDCYVGTKRENEIAQFEKADLKTEEEQIALERDMYLKLY